MTDSKDQKKGLNPRERSKANMIDQPSPEPRRSPPALDETRLRQQAIGVRLRQIFDDVVNEPVPDEFLEILRKHDNRSSEGN